MTDEEPTSDSGDSTGGETLFGDPIPEVFPPDKPDARFVVSMSMATNDIDRACRDLMRSGDMDGPDFSYRVRLVVGHMVEAINALNAYSQEFEEVRKLLKRLPADAQKDLKTVRGTLQNAGADALEDVRDNTFHYPAPEKRYKVTSDERLKGALVDLANRGTEMHVDGDTGAVTLTFADDAAFNLAMNLVTNDEAFRRSEVARDGALAFLRWSAALITTYVESEGHSFGEPRITDKPMLSKPSESPDPPEGSARA